MDLDLTPKSNSTRSPEDGEIDTPPHAAQPIKPKNHHHPPPPPAAAAAPSYKECMRNHAATLGGHAVDGCGEFMPSPSATTADPASLKCAACGCHRSFHRREPESPTAAITPPFLDFRHPPLPKRFSLSPSPPPQQAAAAAVPPYSVFFGLGAAEEHHQAPVTPTAENPAGRKRFRTKFSQEQKEKMQSFSAGLGWKLQKCDEAAVREFCREIGVTKGVLKVWMHNNKNTFGKKLEMGSNGGGAIGFGNNGNGSRKSEDDDDDDGDGGGRRFQNNSGNNGSSSSP